MRKRNGGHLMWNFLEGLLHIVRTFPKITDARQPPRIAASAQLYCLVFQHWNMHPLQCLSNSIGIQPPVVVPQHRIHTERVGEIFQYFR
jgi:hypothetical protein